MKTTLSRQALTEARIQFADWISRYHAKTAKGIPLTMLEEYELMRLTRKLAAIDADIATYDHATKKRSFLKILFSK